MYRPDEYYSKRDWKGTWDKRAGVLIDQAIIPWTSCSGCREIDYLKSAWPTVPMTLLMWKMAEATIRTKNGAIGSLYAYNFLHMMQRFP